MTAWSVTQDDVVAAAQRGQLAVTWVQLLDGIEVMTDAARLDGVRVPVTAATAELIAIAWGCELPTPMTLDLRHAQAVATGLQVEPATQDYRTMQTAEAVLAFNGAVDDAGAPPVGVEGSSLIVSDCGKAWVTTAELVRRQQAGEADLACNYGFFTAAARTPRGTSGPKASVTGRWNVWQEPGYRHNDAHWDYSQTLQLVRVASGAVQPSHDALTARGTPTSTPSMPVKESSSGLGLAVLLGAGLMLTDNALMRAVRRVL